MAPGFSHDEIARCRGDGYVVVPGLFTGAALAALVAAVDELEAMDETPGGIWFYHEDSLLEAGGKVLARLEYFDGFHGDLHRLMHGPELLGRAGALFGEPAVLFKEKVNFKMPGGHGFEPHQDAQAGWEGHGSLHLTAIVSIDPATVENGCIELAAGHNRGLIGDLWKPLAGDQLAGVTFTPYPSAPGDAIFFDSYTPHRSAANATRRRRRALLVTYGRASEGDQRASYFADKRKSFPPDIERQAGKTYEYKV